ncbi:hypothetical protein FDO65_14875 [Nakamurella flava]|uniref:Uncharacterized protein n=1 Tax=Nakamurella flava TaxID=2576308 RepID=A0A4U6QFC8_9ACTN|nr:DUF5336 domain-containing protein [Nakamurella flava]TKV58791.1 hypothetical protein FDO65_14875 [Nakamurella flava]
MNQPAPEQSTGAERSGDHLPAAGDAGWDDDGRDTGPVPVVPRSGDPAVRPGGGPPPVGPAPTTAPPFGPPPAPPPFGPAGFVPPGAVAYGVSTDGPGVPDSRADGTGGTGVPRALTAVVALLGIVNLMAGFLPEVSLPEATRNAAASVSVYAVGPGWVPLLLLIGGLLAAGALMPGGADLRFAAAAVSVAGAIGAVIGLGIPNGFEQLLGNGRGNGAGALLLFIVGTIQAVVAIAAHVMGSGPQQPSDRTAAGRWSSAAQRPADSGSHPFPGGPVTSGSSPWAPGAAPPPAPPAGSGPVQFPGGPRR